MHWLRRTDVFHQFADRTDAGDHLAERLMRFRGDGAVVVGLARGGVVVAAEIARKLQCPLEVLVVRKVGAPFQPELGVGAVGPEGVLVIDKERMDQLGLYMEDIAGVISKERQEVERRLETYRPGRAPPDFKGKSVILVDDGLATGVTAMAAARYARSKSPHELILAVPVCAPQAAEMLAGEVDEVVCVLQPENLMAVGYWYQDFSQTTDEEVIDLLTSLREPEAVKHESR